MKRFIVVLVCFFSLTVLAQFDVFAQSAAAEEPGWYPYLIARGGDRATIENTPILERPYRPFHFYGNSVRRSHFRGNPLPMPQDVARTVVTVTRRR